MGSLREGRGSSLASTDCVFLSPEAPRFESIMEDIDIGVGETPQFSVVVEGKPLPDIMWYKVSVGLGLGEAACD